MGGNYESPRQKYVKSIEGKTNYNMLTGKPQYVGKGQTSGYRWVDAASDLWEWMMGRKKMKDFGTDKVEKLR